MYKKRILVNNYELKLTELKDNENKYNYIKNVCH